MKKILLCMFLLLSLITLGEDGEYIKGKIVEKTERIFEHEIDEIAYVDIFQVEILEGPEKGRVVELEFSVYTEDAYNIPVKKGRTVVLYYEKDEGVYYITDIDKRISMYGLALFFLVTTVVLAGFKGARAILALLLTILMIFYIFLPGVIAGYSPILLSVVVAISASVITIYFMTGLSGKGHVAIFGSIGGVLFAGGISYIFTYRMGLTGYADMDSLNYISILEGIDVRELISAGIILGSMGAVMDVAMSISSALHEVEVVDNRLSPKRIFNIGMNIGRDIIGTMINTLVLAYVGSSLFTIMLLTIQKDEFPLIRILNFEFIAVEILRSFCGSIGILVVVPLTSYLASVFHRRSSEKKKIQ